MKWVKPQSLYLQLLMFLGLPLMLLWGLSAFNSYVSALQAATQAYDRTLLSSARTVSERLVDNKQLEVNVPWVVLDSFELNMNDRLYYKVVNPAGKVISGYDDLPAMPPATSRTRLYPALAWFYHTEYRGEAIRVARLLQPVNEGGIIGMAEIYVAETLQSRRYLARQLLFSSWVSQGLLVLLTLVLVGWLLRRVLRPMRQLSSLMVRREPGLLTPLPELLPWSETRLLIVAFNRYLDRLRGLISRQERFSADASHQLKTPLAVLKTQAAVALASQQPQQWYESLQAMSSTLDNTIQLTERLLQLSAVKRKEQGERHFSPVNLYEVVQSSCFTRLAQVRSKGIDLGYEGEQDVVWIEGDEVLLGELCGNLLDNALKYTPPHGVVTARLLRKGEAVVLVVEDSGPGIDEQMVHQALLPFHRLDNVGNVPGAGIGLALVNDIARLHRTHPQLSRSETLGGLSVRLRFLCLVRDAQDDQRLLFKGHRRIDRDTKCAGLGRIFQPEQGCHELFASAVALVGKRAAGKIDTVAADNVPGAGVCSILERNADIWRPLTGKNCAAVACGAGKGYRVVDAATFMLPGGFCGNNGKLFTVAVIFSHFCFGNADPAKLDGIRSFVRADRDDRFTVDITDVIQAIKRGAKVFCRIAGGAMRTAGVNAANTVDDKNFVDGATGQRRQRIREFSGSDQTEVKGERKCLWVLLLQ